jgi:hypothetical protein
VRTAVRIALTVLLLAVTAVLGVPAPASAAAPVISPASLDYAPGSNAYQDFQVSQAAWTARDPIRISIPADLGVKLDNTSCSSKNTSSTTIECAPRGPGAGTGYRVYYRDYSTHISGSYGKTFTVTATDLTTGETATGTVHIAPKVNVKLWGPFAQPGRIYLSVDDKAGPSIADNVRVRISVTGHLVTTVPSNCAGPLTALVCDLGTIDRDDPTVGVTLPALPGTTGFVTVTAVASSAWPDPDTSNNTGTAGPYDPMGGPGPVPGGADPPATSTGPGSGGNPPGSGGSVDTDRSPADGGQPSPDPSTSTQPDGPLPAAVGSTGPASADHTPTAHAAPPSAGSVAWVPFVTAAILVAMLTLAAGWWWRRRNGRVTAG